MANVSQNIFDKTRLFRKLIFQQGKPAGDYELNEVQDILHEFDADTREFLGGYGFWGDSFLVETTGNPNEIRIRKGLVLTGDSVLVLTEDVILDSGDGLTTPGSNRTDDVYLQVSVEEKGPLDFPDIVNPPTGQELARRLQYILEVKVAQGGVYPTIPAEDQFILFARINRTAGGATILPSEIDDERVNYALTFIEGTSDDAFRIEFTGGLGFDKEASTARVYGTVFSIAAGSHVLNNNSLNFLYVSEAGIFTISANRPTGMFLELYRITTAAGLVINTEDRRRFIPGGLVGISLAEVIQARGTHTSLDNRLDVSLNDDGTVRDCAVGLNSLGDLCPHPNSPASMRIMVDSGQANYGTETLSWPGGLSPLFVAPVTNPRIDLLYITDTGTLAIFSGVEAVSPTAPSHAGKIGIAEISLIPLQTSITVGNIRDVRPLFNLGGGSGSGSSIESRLRDLLDDSVMENGLLEPLEDDSDVDGVSTGTFLGPNEFELSPGETLVSSFASAPTDAPATIPQVCAVVLLDQLVDTADVQIEVDRGGGFETTPGNGNLYNFVGGGTNVLNIRVTNVGVGTFTVRGWGIYFTNIGGSTGVIGADNALYVTSSGLALGNYDPKPAWLFSSGDVGLRYNSGLSTIFWQSTFSVVFRTSTGYVTNTVVGPGSLGSVVAGDYLYIELDTGGGPVTIQRSPTAPTGIDIHLIGIISGTALLYREGLALPGPRFCAFTGGTVALSQTVTNGAGAANTTFTYNLADFTSVDPFYDVSKLRSIYLSVRNDSDSAQTEILATYPDTVERSVSFTDSVAVGDDRSNGSVFRLPVHPTQVSFNIRIQIAVNLLGGGDSARYTIHGGEIYG